MDLQIDYLAIHIGFAAYILQLTSPQPSQHLSTHMIMHVILIRSHYVNPAKLAN